MFASDIRHENPSLEEKLLRLYSLKKGSKIELSFRKPYLDLLQAFGNPHAKLPPVIHVAGTNGKGSVIAMLRAILEAGGYTVHAYTSPHLIRFNERIVLAGREIDDDALESLIDEALILNNGRDITFFEITTAMAFAAFSRTPADILLLETGMGGRLDCTNVVERPAATIITKLGLDHVEYLGDSLGKIAQEKAGIMKRGVPCILAAQDDDSAIPVFEAAANNLNSELFRAGATWFTQANQNLFRFVFETGDKFVEKKFPLPNLKGLHQIQNAGTALAACTVIEDQFPLSDDAVARGLSTVKWPARLQNITARFSHLLPTGWEVWLDGAHNEDAACVLSTQANLWKQKDRKQLHIILGMMGHKSPQMFVRPLLPYVRTVAYVDIPGEPKAHSAQVLKESVCTYTGTTLNHDDFLESIKALVKNNRDPGRILITGSLYLAGHVLKYCKSAAHN